jgi:hypothetical protein
MQMIENYLGSNNFIGLLRYKEKHLRIEEIVAVLPDRRVG